MVSLAPEQNFIPEEIKECIAAGNRTYFVQQNILKSKSRSPKVIIYKLWSPVVTQESEMWTINNMKRKTKKMVVGQYWGGPQKMGKCTWVETSGGGRRELGGMLW